MYCLKNRFFICVLIYNFEFSKFSTFGEKIIKTSFFNFNSINISSYKINN